jgi:hypothetical protein
MDQGSSQERLLSRVPPTKKGVFHAFPCPFGILTHAHPSDRRPPEMPRANGGYPAKAFSGDSQFAHRQVVCRSGRSDRADHPLDLGMTDTQSMRATAQMYCALIYSSLHTVC